MSGAAGGVEPLFARLPGLAALLEYVERIVASTYRCVPVRFACT